MFLPCHVGDIVAVDVLLLIMLKAETLTVSAQDMLQGGERGSTTAARAALHLAVKTVIARRSPANFKENIMAD